jgi:hypothetical protein
MGILTLDRSGKQLMKDSTAKCTLKYVFESGGEELLQDIALPCGTVIVADQVGRRTIFGKTNKVPLYGIERCVTHRTVVVATQFGISETWEILVDEDEIKMGPKDVEQSFTIQAINKMGGQADELEMRRMEITQQRKRTLSLMSRRRRQKARLILTSAPYKDAHAVEVLGFAAAMVKYAGGENCAGDAKDAFHQQTLRGEMTDIELEKHKPFRIAWKGKVTQALSMLSRNGETVIMITVKGGPECDWERAQLEGIALSFQDQGANVTIEHCADLDALYNFLLSAFEPHNCTIS